MDRAHDIHCVSLDGLAIRNPHERLRRKMNDHVRGAGRHPLLQVRKVAHIPLLVVQPAGQAQLVKERRLGGWWQTVAENLRAHGQQPFA